MNANFMLQNATKLTESQMKNVKGGAMSQYCKDLQAWANTYRDDDRVPDSDWDKWTDYWLEHCSK